MLCRLFILKLCLCYLNTWRRSRRSVKRVTQGFSLVKANVESTSTESIKIFGISCILSWQYTNSKKYNSKKYIRIDGIFIFHENAVKHNHECFCDWNVLWHFNGTKEPGTTAGHREESGRTAVCVAMRKAKEDFYGRAMLSEEKDCRR